MASKSMLLSIAFLVIFCFILMKEPSSPNQRTITRYNDRFFGNKAGIFGSYNRKVLEMEKNSGGDEKRDLNLWELRRVPSGPDPLHHNGANPKKPRSP